MSPPLHRRTASLQAEAVNKLIAEQALRDAEDPSMADLRSPMSTIGLSAPAMSPERLLGAFSSESSPLSSLTDGAPTPGSGWGSSGGMGPGMQIRREAAGKPDLIQQVQRAKAAGINAEGVVNGVVNKTGGQMEAAPPNGPGHRGVSGWVNDIFKKSNGGPGGSGRMGTTPKKTNMKNNQPLSTPPNKGRNGLNGGSTQKIPKAKDGNLPSSSPLDGGGSVQKRQRATYLENVPDEEEEEREHKRPAQRRWGVAAPSGPIRRPLNLEPALPPLYEQGPRKIYVDPKLLTSNGSDANLFDLSHILVGEIRHNQEPPPAQIFGFEGLPQYVPPDYNDSDPEDTEPDILGFHEEHLKKLDERIQTAVETNETHREERRLQAVIVELLGSQQKNMEEMQTRPKPTEILKGSRYHNLDESILALMKLKPARKKIDPPLFAEGTWHKSRRMEDEHLFDCSFCTFDCDYGVSDARVWLPLEASGVFCLECHKATITSLDGWKVTFDSDKEQRYSLKDNEARLKVLSETVATPPLKELADTLGFKKKAAMLQRGAGERQHLKDGQQTGDGDLQEVPDPQQYNEHVMSAFNGAAGSQISPMLSQNSVTAPQLSAKQALQTFPLQDQQRLTAWLTSEPPQRQHQFREFMNSLNGRQQWIILDQCRKRLAAGNNPLTGAPNVTPKSSPQVMDTRVQTLGPAQQQFMMQSMNETARGQISPIMEGGPDAPLPILNSELARSNNQRRLSIDNIPPASQLSTQSTPSGTGAPNAQKMGTAPNGHHRPTSYTDLPPPNLQTIVNFGGVLDGQQNPIAGPSGDSLLFKEPSKNDIQGHHRRTSSGTISMPSPTMIRSGGATPTLGQNGWPINGPSSSPAMPPPMFNRSNNQQRRLSNGSMVASSPTMMFEGGGTPNGQQGQFMNGPGSSPPMPPPMPNGAMSGNNIHQRRLSDTLPPPLSQMMINGNGAPNIQQGRAVSGLGSSSPLQPALQNGPVSGNPLQRRLSNSNMPQQALMSLENGMPMDQHGLATINSGAERTSVATPELRNETGSPPIPTNGKNSNQRRLSNSGNRPVPLQTPANSQSVQTITLMRSGGTIGPTTIPNNIGVANNANTKSRSNFTSSPTPANSATVQCRNSNGQQGMRSVNGPSGSPPMWNNTTAPSKVNARSHPRGSSPSAPAIAPVGLGITTGQQMAGAINDNHASSNFGPPLNSSGSTPMRHGQAKARRPSNPSGALTTPSWSPLDTQSNTQTPNSGPGPSVLLAIPPSYFPAPSRGMNNTQSRISTSTTPNPGSSPFIHISQPHGHTQSPSLHHAHASPLPNSQRMGPPPRPDLRGSSSDPQPDAHVNPPYESLLFCRGCPWRQIDIKKVRICEECKAEKLDIIKHRHTDFVSLHETRGEDLEKGAGIGWGQLASTHRTTCMICPSLATSKCSDCPLRVCTVCEVQLRMMCTFPRLLSTMQSNSLMILRAGKGQIWTLVLCFSQQRQHLRNDVSCFVAAACLAGAGAN